jgi:hypothetical protein
MGLCWGLDTHGHFSATFTSCQSFCTRPETTISHTHTHKLAPLHNNLWAIPALHKVLICIRTDDGYPGATNSPCSILVLGTVSIFTTNDEN